MHTDAVELGGGNRTLAAAGPGILQGHLKVVGGLVRYENAAENSRTERHYLSPSSECEGVVPPARRSGSRSG